MLRLRCSRHSAADQLFSPGLCRSCCGSRSAKSFCALAEESCSSRIRVPTCMDGPGIASSPDASDGNSFQMSPDRKAVSGQLSNSVSRLTRMPLYRGHKGTLRPRKNSHCPCPCHSQKVCPPVISTGYGVVVREQNTISTSDDTCHRTPGRFDSAAFSNSSKPST